MTDFTTKLLPAAADVLAPDGSEVRILLGLPGGGMAHFRLAPGQVAKAITHRTVEEIWYILAGRGRMWRRSAARQAVFDLKPGLCLTIPIGTHFQFRCDGDAALDAVALTMPPWPGEDEAVIVDGPWAPTV